MAAVGGARTKTPFLPGFKALGTHQAQDAVFAATFSLIEQIGAHAQAAVGLAALGKALANQNRQSFILSAARPRGFLSMSGKTTGADLEGLRQRIDWMLIEQRLH